MNEWLLYLSLVLGITYLLTESFVFAWWRLLFRNRGSLQYLVYCSSCVGFWVGVFASAAHLYPIEIHGPPTPHAPFVAAFLSGLTSIIVNQVFVAWKGGGNPAFATEHPDGHQESQEEGSRGHE